MNEKSKHILSQQTIRCGFPISFGNLRRSCYGLSRRNSLLIGVGCDVPRTYGTPTVNFLLGFAVPEQPMLALGFCGAQRRSPLPISSESMNAIAVTGSAHQSQFKMSSGNFLPIESGDFPTVLRPGAAEGATTPQRPAYQVYPAI